MNSPKTDWAEIPGYRGAYKVSTHGEVMNMTTGKLLRPFRQTHKKYMRVNLYDSTGKLRQFGVHQLVMLAFVGSRPEGKNINHKDGNPENNNISNLEYCTYSENIRHAYKNGLATPMAGSRNGMAKLKEDEVNDIKHLIRSGFSNQQLSEMFCVSSACIAAIRKGEIWPNAAVGPWHPGLS